MHHFSGEADLFLQTGWPTLGSRAP